MRVRNANVFLALAAVSLFVSGCMSGSTRHLRLAPYSPNTQRGGAWLASLRPSEPEPAVDHSVEVPPVGVEVAVVPGTVAELVTEPEVIAEETRRLIKNGDRLNIALLGIPDAQKIEDTVDGDGEVSLPHIGSVRIAGLTTSEAESRIEEAYIKGDIYPAINVIVVSLDDEFFIQGEIRRPGRFPLTGGMTLMKAIATASAYTEFAKKTKVQIIRGQEVMVFNMKRIEAGKDKDPMIERGDSIIVPRRWWW